MVTRVGFCLRSFSGGGSKWPVSVDRGGFYILFYVEFCKITSLIYTDGQ